MEQSTKSDAKALSYELTNGSSVSKPQTKVFTEGIRRVISITEVFGDGQKPSAAALEYLGEIDSASISTDDFQVEGQSITSVFTNSEAALTDCNIPGNYVILKFAYKNTKSPTTMGGRGRKPGSGMSHGDAQKQNRAGVDGGKFRGGEQVKMNLSVSVSQIGEVMGTDGTIYPASENPIKSNEHIDLVLQDFQLLEYTDPDTGWSIPYSLYLPKNYDKTKEYPLLFFVADAGANCDDPIRNLTQGNGATIWATPKEQAKHECIVLSPQYTNTLIDSIGALTTDDNVWSDGLTLVSNLLHYVIETYPIDKNRIYGTGQSQGCMTNIALSDRYPDLFAAQLLVAGQWNVEEMSAMKDKKLWIVVCEGDFKAYPGMNAATQHWESLGSCVARSEMWDNASTAEQFEELVAQMEAQGCKINYAVLKGGNHPYTWSVVYNIEGIRNWLFAQTKES